MNFPGIEIFGHFNPGSKHENPQANGIQPLLEIETRNMAPSIAIGTLPRQHQGQHLPVGYFDHGYG